MRAIILKNQQLAFHDDVAEPSVVSDDETIVEVVQAGICETDLQLAQGYMNYEGILGHEFVGIARTGEWAGRRVVSEINCSCWRCPTCQAGLSNHCPQRTVLGILGRDGAFADLTRVPTRNLHLVPDDLSDDHATFTEPLAAAFQIPEQVDLRHHSKAVVIGDGRLGYLCAQVLQQSGCAVTVVGKHHKKLERFRHLGMQTEHVQEVPVAREFGLAVDCSGNVSGMATALQWLQPRGILVLKTTVQAEHQISLAPIVIDEISVVGSRCGPFAQALLALQEQRIEVDSLLTGRFPIEQAAAAFEAAGSRNHLKVILDIRK